MGLDAGKFKKFPEFQPPPKKFSGHPWPVAFREEESCQYESGPSILSDGLLIKMLLGAVRRRKNVWRSASRSLALGMRSSEQRAIRSFARRLKQNGFLFATKR
jgi:hypothetical protein